jgi:hypothetical protein
VVVLIAIFIARALDIVALLSIVGGLIARNRWQVFAVGVGAGVIQEILLSSVAPAHRFNAVFVLLGIAAQLSWAFIAFAVRNKRRARKQLKV